MAANLRPNRMINAQMREAQERRKKIEMLVLSRNGITLAEICATVKMSRTPVQGHLEALRAEGAITCYRAPDHVHGKLSRRNRWAAPGTQPDFPEDESAQVLFPRQRKKIERVARQQPDDYVAPRTVKAVQIGMTRDPLIAAMYGSGPAPAPVDYEAMGAA